MTRFECSATIRTAPCGSADSFTGHGSATADSRAPCSGVTESLFWGPKGGGADLHLGGQEDGIVMKGAQSKVKWGEAMGAEGVNGGS